MSSSPATARGAQWSSRVGWSLVVLGLVVPPIGLFLPTVLAVLGHLRVSVANFATAIPLLLLSLILRQPPR